MTERNLLNDPCWSAKDLGEPLPSSPHAVSVALPRWEDVIAYEEKVPACLNSLKAIYPRFGFNPFVAEIARKSLAFHGELHQSSWPFPNIASALSAQKHCHHDNSECYSKIKDFLGISCLIVDQRSTPSAKAFWQHTGLGLSSREAAIALGKEKKPSTSDGGCARAKLLNRLANLYECDSNLIQLHRSGMAALTSILSAIKDIKGDSSILQIGFPYVDVLKLPQIIFQGSDLTLKTKLNYIKALLDKKQPAALIIEIPSNPLLKCVDLISISKLAKDRNIPVIVDDTIGSSINVHLTPYADVVFSSLTKSFAGRGDILAGSTVISPYSKWKIELTEIMPKAALSSLSDSDAIELEIASRDVKDRLKRLNISCLKLKEKLETKKEISKVLHPQECKNFNSLLKKGGGYGCLLSFELKGGIEESKRIYDSLRVCKGPSLGTNFTLVCPYVQLAHFNELKWAESCGVSEHLLRVSVGLEDEDELWSRFNSVIEKK
ncbi:PLP-dependent transferase [Prochlorococcus marinus]|uniref:Cystathionine gamma-synthase n=1 Tax=Prochlorococcus marinus XMU1408 TaxID=2213228 RepID=A0A318QZL2_PROMR|nr:PLP-dependent transferase [Prochlorococcus marinus]MBW3041424.1 cystathionine gamma-synthase [Prochlorococcus marinus str. XMU1408]PYE02586.1 cystathionine gamma-synthase [Prochlorococcus marinus XMU1408]